MKIELNKHLQDKIQKSLEQIYGVGNVGTMSQEAYDDHMNSLPKPKQSDEPEFPEPEIELVQCSRCLHKQMADISQSIAIKCKWCDEIDAAYLEGDFIDI